MRTVAFSLSKALGVGISLFVWLFSIEVSAQENNTRPLLFVGPDGARPYIYSENERHAGIMADVVDEISRVINRPIEIKLFDFREARRMVEAGEADAVMPLSLSPDRMKQFDFPTPLFDLTFTVFARENEAHPAGWPNLKGVRVGVFGKGISKTLAAKWYPNADHATVSGSARAMLMLQQSEIDAMITTRRTGNQAIYQNKITNVAALPIALSSTPAGLAIRKGNQELFEVLESAIVTLQKDGTITQILSRWESTRVLLFTKGEVWTVTALTATGVALVFIVLGFFYLRQRNIAAGKLTQSEERQRTTLNSIGDAVIATDTDERVTHINAVARELTGWSAADAVSRPLHDVFQIINAKTREPVANPVDRVLAEGKRVGMANHTLLIAKDGREYQIADSAAPIRDDAGRITGVVLVFRDVTDEYAIQQDLRNALSDAERANEAKSEFLASMSHELRTPLNAVLGYSQMMLFDTRTPLTNEQKEHVESIMEGGNHLLDLVNEILDLAKVEADRLDLVIEDVNANEAVVDCLNMVGPLAERNKVTLVDHFSNGPNATLSTDLTRFKQVLINLLSNAIKFNKEHGTVTVHGTLSDDCFLRLSVVDTGVGIADKDKDSVFHLFHRLESSATISREGTGIGLTVTKLLVERMAGEIGFESEKGVGSTFWIDLPLASNEDVMIWSDPVRVGVDAIDKDHQTLINLQNRIRADTNDVTEIDSVIRELVNHTRHHFRREEAMMAACGYPDLASHRKAHEVIFNRLEDLSARWKAGRERAALKDIHALLREWLFDHTLREDSKITKYVGGYHEEIRKALDNL